jgi:hypothetical protein
MKIYLDCHEEQGGSTRTIKEFLHNGKKYILDECIPGGVDISGIAKGCQNFVCRIGRKRFYIYCEEKYTGGKLQQRYFVLKNKTGKD